MATDISICSQALLKLGAKEITSFSDGTDRSKICANVYPDLRKGLLGLHDWWFCMQKTELSRETAAPENEWTYSFLLPSGLGADGPTAVFNDNAVGADPIIEFEVFAGRVYANASRIWIDYKFEAAEATWPTWFVQLAIAAVCAEIAYAITDQANVAQTWHSRAYGTPQEAGLGGLVATSMTLNAQHQSVTSVASDDLITVRNG